MSYVYILRSLKTGRYYIGSTVDVQRRFNEHQSGKVSSTRNFLPFEMVFKQSFQSVILARKIEKKLKSFKRRDFIDRIVQEGKIKCVNGSDVPT